MDSYAWGIDQPPQARMMRNGAAMKIVLIGANGYVGTTLLALSSVDTT